MLLYNLIDFILEHLGPTALSFWDRVQVIFWHNLKKNKNTKTLLKKLLIIVLHVPIILGIIKKIFGYQEADPGGWPDTGIKVTLQYSFIYV